MKQIRSRTLASVGLSVAALTLASACGGVENSEGGSRAKSLQLANNNPPSDSTSKAMDWWIEEVEAAVPGEVDMDQKYSGSLLAGPDMRAGLSEGRAAGGQLIPAYYPTEMSLTNVASVPVPYDSQVIAKATQKLIAENETVAAEYSAAGLEPLYVGTTGTFMIATPEDVTDLDDLDGLAIRMIPTLADAYKQLGVEPVFVDAAELYESLERGVIDGAMSVLPVLHSSGLQEVAPNFVIDGVGNMTIWVFAMGTDTFEALDESVQDAMREVSTRTTEQTSVFVTESEVEACKGVIEDGGKFTVLDDDDQATVREAAEVLVESWYTTAEEAGYERAELEAIWEEYNRYLEEFEPTSTAKSGLESCL
jgi:TRAP-type C4-dicarboxylate transport system substrate-binding protein